MLALVVAVGLVAGALLIRRSLDGDEEVADDTVISPVVVDDLRIACPPIVVESCRSIEGVEVVEETAGRTVERLIDPTFDPAAADVDAWLVPLPWVGVAEQLAGDDVLADPGNVLARSELVILGWDERLEWLELYCGTVDWSCIGDHAGDEWVDIGGGVNAGAVDAAHRSPEESAIGLLEVGTIATDYFGDPDFASNQMDSTFRSWFSNLEEATGGSVGAAGETPVDEMLRIGPGGLDLVAATRFEAEAAVELREGSDDPVRFVAADDPTTADLVLVGVSGAPGEDSVSTVAPELAAALDAAGWDPPGGPPPTSGLPNDGVMLALRMLWEVITE
ncbi:MAG: hypothetical protein S0880_07865 [Actinomycetota bacterium]|nr:hypothetical protein [Actinomycetota bacterium]